METLLNANYGLLEWNQLDWLQSDFDILMVVFELLGLKTNVKNMLGMSFQIWHISGRHSDSAYTHQITSEGLSYQACQMQRVHRPECAPDVKPVSMSDHTQSQHVKYSSGDAMETPTNKVTSEYHVSFPKTGR